MRTFSIQKQNSNIIQEQPQNMMIEMDCIIIGQPITREGQLLETPLIQLHQSMTPKINQAPTPMNLSRVNNIQLGSPSNAYFNSYLSQIRAEQFPDSALPQTLFCFKCSKMVITAVKQQYGCGTYSIAAVLCCLFFPCAIIPFIDKTCKDYLHFCRECNTYLGKKVFLCRLC